MIEDEDDDFTAESPPSTKAGAMMLVIALHVVAILAIIRAFAPDFTNQVAETVLSAVTVTVTTPPPSPTPEPKPAGKSGEEGKKAVPREVKAVKPKVELAKASSPKASSSGSADTSGAANSGAGTGAGGPGNGTGSGAGGSGTGGGGSALVKTAGEISAARDFPKKTRDLRAGQDGDGGNDRRR